jgi:hypothetical protein
VSVDKRDPSGSLFLCTQFENGRIIPLGNFLI